MSRFARQSSGRPVVVEGLEGRTLMSAVAFAGDGLGSSHTVLPAQFAQAAQKVRLTDITDGTSNTILVGEAAPRK